MPDNVKDAGTEGIVATPEQQKFNLTNKEYFGTLTDLELASYQPSNTKQAIDNSFSQNKDWREYLTNPVRNIKPNLNYRSFKQLEKMWRKPEFASIVEMAGSDMASGGQLLSDYVDWDKVSWWNKQKIAMDAAYTGAQLSSAKTKLIELQQNGADQIEIDKANAEVQRLENYMKENTRPYDSDTANAFAGFATSIARTVPEMVLTSLATTALIPTGAGAAAGATRLGVLASRAFTGGAKAVEAAKLFKAARGVQTGLKTARGLVQGGAQFGVIYNDTYRTTMGGVYERLKSENPSMTDDQLYDMADRTASVEATIESIPSLFGVGKFVSTTSGLNTLIKSVATGLPQDTIRRAAFLQVFREGINKEVGKRLAAGVAKDTIADTLTEVVQSAAENAASSIAMEGGSADDIVIGTLGRMGSFIIDPLNPKYKDELDTLLATLPAAMAFGGVGPAFSYAGHKINQGSAGTRLSDMFKNRKFAADLHAYTQQNKDKMGPEALKEFISGMSADGSAPTSAFFDRNAVKELADTDPEFRNAMDRLGVLKQLEESEGNGGVIEVPLAEYNDVVNGDKSDVLYSKVKDMVTFSIDSMSMSQLNEWLASVEIQNKKEIQKAMADENSVYNKTLRELSKQQGMTEDQLKVNASLMQLVANRVASSFAKPITGEQWFEENVVLAQGEPTKFNTKEALSQSIKYDTPYISNGNNFVLTQGMGGETQVLHLTDEAGNILSSIEIGKDNIVRETFTAEEQRRKGLGTKLVKEAERLFGDLGITTASKEAKQFWDNLGYTKSKKGIKYKKEDSSLKQKTTGQKVAGWFNVIDGKYVVGLTDKWNATTFSHEVFHLYSRALQDNYNAGTMTSYWKAQTEKLFNTVEAKPNKKGQYKLTRSQEELLAERFTTYLLDNKIENPELNSIFALLRDAFDKTYKQLDMTKYAPDKKTKEAFAVIFGAQDVVIAEQRALGLLEIEKPEGVSQEAYDHYMAFLLESRAKSTHDMIKKYYAVEKYKQSKKYGELYDATYTANLRVVEQEPRFQMKAIAKQINSTEPNDVMLAYNDTHPEALVTFDEVIEALNDTSNATEVAEARTAEAMDEHIKEEFKIPENQTLVSKDMKNVSMAKAFLMEALMSEGKDWKDFEGEYTKLLNAVETQVQKMPLSKLQNSRRWSQLESVYAQQYQMYTATGQKEKAASVRRAQAQVVLIQNKMFEMNNRVDRFLEKFPRKLRNAQPQGKSIMSAESWDLLQSLMEKYGFKIADKRRNPEAFNIKLEKWLSNIEESEYCPISNLRYFMPETAQGHEGSFGSMNVRQFEVLEHVATAINSVASREYNLITEAEKIKYDTLVALTAKRLQDKGIKPYEKTDTWWRKNFGVLSNIVNPEPILKALFPEEVMQSLVRPLFTAAAQEEVSYNKWNDRWNQMSQKVNLSDHKKQYSTGHVLSYNNVGNLLLAMGNQHAYENWRLFLKIDETQAETIIAEALAEQPALAEFANEYWAMMSKTTDLMNTSYRKRYNKLFVKKEPRAFKIGNYEFTGGYVPESKLVSALPENAQWESIVMGELGNEKLLSDKPDGQDLQSIVDNTRSRLRLFARWGHVAPEFNNFVRFVQREDVGAVIGTRAQNYIKGWLRDYHTPAGDSAGLMHALMAATTTGVLGMRLPQALLQLSGFIPSMGLLGRGGIRYMIGSIGRALSEGGLRHQVQSATKKSDYMAARYSDPVKTLFGVSKAEIKISKAVGSFQKLAMSMISYMDAIVSNATWDASYRMSIDKGLTHEQAKEKADQDVRLSQTDALTISRSRAMKSDWARIITPFSTYMMGMQSVVRGRIAEKEYMGALMFFLSYTVVSTAFESMLKEFPMPWEDDDDEKYIEKVLKRWYNDSISTGGSTLYPIAGLGSDFAKSFAWAVESIINPDEKPYADMWSGGSVAALTYAKQYPDAMRFGMVGLFNGDEDAQRKAIANFVGWFSSGGKKMLKEIMDD